MPPWSIVSTSSGHSIEAVSAGISGSHDTTLPPTTVHTIAIPLTMTRRSPRTICLALTSSGSFKSSIVTAHIRKIIWRRRTRHPSWHYHPPTDTCNPHQPTNPPIDQPTHQTTFLPTQPPTPPANPPTNQPTPTLLGIVLEQPPTNPPTHTTQPAPCGGGWGAHLTHPHTSADIPRRTTASTQSMQLG